MNTNGHASNGRWQSTPFAAERRRSILQLALLDVASPARIRRIGEALLKAAEAGDVSAAKLVLQHVVGEPAPMVNPDAVAVKVSAYEDSWRAQVRPGVLDEDEPPSALPEASGMPLLPAHYAAAGALLPQKDHALRPEQDSTGHR